jgi:hypothetical protein
MEQYVRWYVELEPFYKILIIGSMLIGVLAVGVGMGTQNPIFFLLGLAWLAGGPATIVIVSRFEAE